MKTGIIVVIVVLVLAFLLSALSMVVTHRFILNIPMGDMPMIAHRGLSGLHTENTVAAFEGAANEDYWGIETDVHVTKDGVYVLVHDDNLLEFTGVDVDVKDATYEELLKITLKDTHGDGKSATYMPTLAEYAKICRDSQKRAVLELKADFTKEQIAEILVILEEEKVLDNTTFISFGKENLIYLRELKPDAKAQYLNTKGTEDAITFAIENKLDLSVNGWYTTPAKVKAIHDAGLEYAVWTVDWCFQAWYLKLIGVDYVTSNILV